MTDPNPTKYVCAIHKTKFQIAERVDVLKTLGNFIIEQGEHTETFVYCEDCLVDHLTLESILKRLDMKSCSCEDGPGSRTDSSCPQHGSFRSRMDTLSFIHRGAGVKKATKTNTS